MTDVYSNNNESWDSLNIEMITDQEGDNIWIPVYIAIAIFIGLALVYNVIMFLISSPKAKNKDSENPIYGTDSKKTENLLVNEDDSKSKINNELDSNKRQAPAAKGTKDMSQRV
jgi:hypothetical protein